VRVVKRIKLKAEVKNTRFLAGKAEDIAGQWLDVLEVNREGDHLSIASVGSGRHLVNVAKEDIADECGIQSNTFINLGLAEWVEGLLGRKVERSSHE
jgi:hypothetical protein